MSDLTNRITINPEQCGGRPCIRGMRIRVNDVLDLLAAGLTPEDLHALTGDAAHFQASVVQLTDNTMRIYGAANFPGSVMLQKSPVSSSSTEGRSRGGTAPRTIASHSSRERGSGRAFTRSPP